MAYVRLPRKESRSNINASAKLEHFFGHLLVCEYAKNLCRIDKHAVADTVIDCIIVMYMLNSLL